MISKRCSRKDYDDLAKVIVKILETKVYAAIIRRI